MVAAALSAELAASYTVRQADALVEQALHSGVALLLLDGLDEVPVEGTPRQRADRATVLQVVREFAQLYPCVKHFTARSWRPLLDILKPGNIGR